MVHSEEEGSIFDVETKDGISISRNVINEEQGYSGTENRALGDLSINVMDGRDSVFNPKLKCTIREIKK